MARTIDLKINDVSILTLHFVLTDLNSPKVYPDSQEKGVDFVSTPVMVLPE